ncbi:hypothetical protein P7C70_g2990, partial [Phenoliferia sp. Uapishka_3]
MPTQLLDLPDELLLRVCQATAQQPSEEAIDFFTIPPVNDLYALSHVNRSFRRITQRPLWRWVDLTPAGGVAWSRWRYAMLADSPRLWTEVIGMTLEVEATSLGATFASLALSLAVNLVHLRFISLESEDSPEVDYFFPISLSNRLRRLPLQTLRLKGFNYLCGFEDTSFHILNDLPALRDASLDGFTLSGQLITARGNFLTRCEAWVYRDTIPKLLARACRTTLHLSVEQHLFDESECWNLGDLDVLEASFEHGPISDSRKIHRTRTLTLGIFGIFKDDPFAFTSRFFQVLGKLSSLRELKLSMCGAFMWLPEWSMDTCLPNVISLSIGTMNETPETAYLEQVRSLLRRTLVAQTEYTSIAQPRRLEELLEFISCFPNLHELHLDDWTRSYNLEALPNFTTLQVASRRPYLHALLGILEQSDVDRVSFSGDGTTWVATWVNASGLWRWRSRASVSE